MAENSKIEWTHNTFNPVIGCTKVAAGCANCYAEGYAKRYGQAVWGPGGTRTLTSPKYWQHPLKWNREAERDGVRRRVFCASLADMFEDWKGNIQTWEKDKETGQRTIAWWRNDIGVCRAGQTTIDHSRGERLATMDDVRRRLFNLIDATPHLDWLLLTKRPENIVRMWPESDGMPLPSGLPPVRLPKYRKNVWLGTSIAEQRDADKNIPELLKCRDLAPVLFVSAEPLIGPIDPTFIHQGFVRSWLTGDWTAGSDAAGYQDGEFGRDPAERIDWMIVGGESGHNSRPMHPDWARSIRDQCTAAGVPFLFKQWGEWGAVHQPIGGAADQAINGKIDCSYGEWHPNGEFVDSCVCGVGSGTVARVGKKAAGRLLDGKEWNEMPAVEVVQ